jgi:hypothetical protein
MCGGFDKTIFKRMLDATKMNTKSPLLRGATSAAGTKKCAMLCKQ